MSERGLLMAQVMLSLKKLAALNASAATSLHCFEVWCEWTAMEDDGEMAGAGDAKIQVSVKAYSYAHAVLLVMQQAGLERVACASVWCADTAPVVPGDIVSLFRCSLSARGLMVADIVDYRAPLLWPRRSLFA
jgi:hypothetical protein